MPSALSFPDQTRRLRLEVAAQPNRLDEACRATGQIRRFALQHHFTDDATQDFRPMTDQLKGLEHILRHQLICNLYNASIIYRINNN